MNESAPPFPHLNEGRGVTYDQAARFGQAGEFAAHVSAEEYRATIRRIEAARRLEAAETVRLRTSLEARIAQLEITVKALVERG